MTLLCRLFGHRWEHHHAIMWIPGAVYWCPRCGETELR